MDQARPASAAPVVLYELNEVPWRVVDWYVARRPRSHLAAALRDAETYTSVTHDTGELHPWTTWPTVHRGVYNSSHNIRFINQDLAAAAQYPPLWEVLAKAGKKVGVFGSMQSYPPPRDASYAFYVPDTFAAGPETIPGRYSCFQVVNLQQTQADGAVAKPAKLDARIAANLARLFVNGLSARTAYRLAQQLAAEKRSPLHRSRRAMLQAPVSFDVFKHALEHSAPDFCTYFTNHVAGIMHRYWKYAFPEDFDYRIESDADRFHAQSLEIAMAYADEQIGYLRRYVDAREGRLYIVSSMGQEAIDRAGEHDREIRIEDLSRFVRRIGYRKPFESRMAMHPNFTVELASSDDAATFVERVSSLVGADGRPAFYDIDVEGNTVLFSIGCTRELVEGGRLRTPGGTEIPFAELGIEVMQRDAGTGYHQPLGIVIRCGANVAANDRRTRIESVDIAPLLFADLGLDVEATLAGWGRRRERAAA
ncbi:MAG TPA: alkaline phosphatase family protein [Burkholderiales bacterium]|nr:alkaline phosphatase family protein [Burkholderiales bacterium]